MFQQFKKILPFLISSLVLIVFVVPLLTLAQEGTSNQGREGTSNQGNNGTGKVVKIDIINPFKCPNGGADNKCTIPDFIRVIIEKILMPIGGVVAVLMIMWAGFLYVTAGGNETQIKKAHEALTWAVIGAAILLGAWVISAAIQGTINELSKS